ncbi:MAG: hypothetical protein ACETWM_17080 [Candidatus Lokiarchaeia archaeon]
MPTPPPQEVPREGLRLQEHHQIRQGEEEEHPGRAALPLQDLRKNLTN